MTTPTQPTCPPDCREVEGLMFNEPAVLFVRADGHVCGYRRPVTIPRARYGTARWLAYALLSQTAYDAVNASEDAGGLPGRYDYSSDDSASVVAESIRRAGLVRAACKIARDAVNRECAVPETVPYVEPTPAIKASIRLVDNFTPKIDKALDAIGHPARRELAIIRKDDEGNPIRQGLTPTEIEGARRVKLWNKE